MHRDAAVAAAAAAQTKSALALLDAWAPIDVDDALELLTKQFSNDGKSFECVAFFSKYCGLLLFMLLHFSRGLMYPYRYLAFTSSYLSLWIR